MVGLRISHRTDRRYAPESLRGLIVAMSNGGKVRPARPGDNHNLLGVCYDVRNGEAYIACDSLAYAEVDR